MKNEQYLYREYLLNFYKAPTHKFTSSGRFELIGNHTDHNGGLCVAASCDLSIYGYVAKNDDNSVVIHSIGYKDVEVDLNDLTYIKKEEGTSNGLVKGIAKYYLEKGYKIGGFSLVSESSIFKGAGVSSSAAFEALVSQIFNVLFNEGKISKLEMAKAGQFAENKYFGKQSGLLDQSAICYGNISYFDFSKKEPLIETLSFPFDDLDFFIINSGGSHATMSNLYSSIPLDMKNAAKKMNKNILIEASEKELEESKDKLSENEYLRAKHFYEENERVKKLIESIKNKDKKQFLEMIKQSFISSRDNLKNMMVESSYKGSPLEACDYAYEFLGEEGAAKINGGGFAGSIIVCLPKSRSEEFVEHMSKKYPRSNISLVHINPCSPIVEEIKNS